MSSVLRSRRPTAGPETGKDAGELTKKTPKLELMSLPTEIHLAISEYLIYPDALSLKHTNAHFYSLVDTGINLKVEWLVERRSLHLECPNDRRCDLGSDLRFCRGSVPLLMRRRREHVECESRPGLGCLVTDYCTIQKLLIAKMSLTIDVDASHIPLLNDVLATFHAHIQELLIIFSKLSEVRDHIHESDNEKRRHMNMLIRHCCAELDWNTRTYEMYKDLRDMILPSSSRLASRHAGACEV
ncbi:f-box domain-containing [Fusarium longipes]|uniref:F-box domain-containing n=1 Tax=Fusarium longipes TaxID=694270 RepID=A0A395SQ61_9HYPO|nr:f-box domain-containing [Fusarium longipes]